LNFSLFFHVIFLGTFLAAEYVVMMSPDIVLKRHFWAVLLAPIALTAYVQASGIMHVVGTALTLDEKALAGPPEGSRGPLPVMPSDHTTSSEKILRRNPFDSVRGDLTPAVESEGEASLPSTEEPYRAPSCDGVKVVATAVSDDASWSFAALSGGSGEGTSSKLKRQGDEYAGKKVWFIRWDRIWLIGTGAFCQAEMFATAPPASPASTSGSTPAPVSSSSSGGFRGVPEATEEMKNNIRRISATEIEVNRSFVDKLLENQGDLMKAARIVPEQEGGKTVGLRVSGVRPNTLLGLLGIESGDRLEKINGFDMSSPEKALEVYAKIRTAQNLTVAVNRGGKPTNLEIHIK